MVINTSVSGRMAKITDKAPSLGQVATNTSVSTKMTKRTDKAPIPLPAINTSVSTRVANGTDKAPTPSPMVAYPQKAFGKITSSNMLVKILTL